MIKVVVVDDEPEWLDLYVQTLSLAGDLEIVGSARTKDAAVEAVDRSRPDIVILDLNLSTTGFEGVTVISNILRRVEVKIIVATSYFEEGLIKEAFARGAVEYILKKDLLQLPGIIKEVYAGRSPHAVLAEAFAYQKKADRFNLLSKTEKELLRLKRAGLTHQEIQVKSCKTISTIKNQVTSILAKLRVANCQMAIEIFREFIDKS